MKLTVQHITWVYLVLWRWQSRKATPLSVFKVLLPECRRLFPVLSREVANEARHWNGR
jgi:hypothetical protein